MPVSLFDASVPVFLRYLDRLEGLVRAAEVFGEQTKRPAAALLDARLAPDMLPFERQVLIATHFTLRAAFPLAGQPIPPYGEFADTFAGMRARIDHARQLLRSLQPQQFAGAESRVLQSQAGRAVVELAAPEFLFQYAMPNFFFHLSAAYAVLRSQGVALGKQDFDGFHIYPREG